MKFFRLCLLSSVLTALAATAATLPELFNERLKSVVAVEFLVQAEIERQPVLVRGTVVDEAGTIIIPGVSILPGVAPDQLKDFKVYRPGSTEPFTAVYLGQDALTTWHFLRVEEKLRPELVPITRYGVANADPALSDELWGIGLRNKDEDFLPYFVSSRVAAIMKLPQKTALLISDVAGPGLPVFTNAGQLAGLALPSFGQNYLLFARNQRPGPIVLMNVEESSVVQLADEVLPYVGRIPESLTGRPVTWFGAYGLQPMAPEVAKLLKLENQSGVVLSDIIAGTPADQAGLKERDIVLAIDGQPLPRLKPDRIVTGYFDREILRHRPGEALTLSILRGGAREEIKVKLGDAPKFAREADRHYFERLGFTVREFLYADGIMHRASPPVQPGVMVHFVKSGGPVATAGLRQDDWVKEIDGTEIKTYASALEKLQSIESDKTRTEFVLLVSRGGETSVLRVKLN